MEKPSSSLLELQQRLAALEAENAQLRNELLRTRGEEGISVTVPEGLAPVFDKAQETVRTYFKDFSMNPTRGTIEINDQRYVLVRASAFSKGFLETIQGLYADRGEAEAFAIGRNFLFDYAHVIGMHDAKNFHAKMELTDPIAKLSAGPIHFAFSGWAFVNISPESNPTPDDDFCLVYSHPYSFEADSWQRAGVKSKEPVCVMNAGYSSGWCEESFGMPLTAVEVTCTARGDDACRFIMSPPHRVHEHLERFKHVHKQGESSAREYNIPTFFERKRVEEEMEKSRKLAEESAQAKASFLANMSHELRTPLGAILGFADLLQKTRLDAEQQDYLDAIHVSGKSLLSIINDVLDLSRLDAGKFLIENLPFSIHEVMRTILVMFASKAADKGLQFSCIADPSIKFQLVGDPMRLTQILVNLAGNALKFTESGSIEIKCHTERQDKENVLLHCIVRDTGIGIADEKLDSIFERFTQADTEITRKYGGTGLGLAITKQLVELQNGKITVESREGEGTTFQFSIPYIVSKSRVHKIELGDEAKMRLYNNVKKVMVVDDNLMNQKLISILLQQQGFEVMIAKNGRKAIELAREKAVDLILLDIQMPGMDGYKTAKILREELDLTIPIIALTAHALSDEKEKCLQAGMNDYLAKPFHREDLLDKISWWSSKRKTSKQTTRNGSDKPAVINLSFLERQTRNNKTFITEMINIFVEENPKDLENLLTAISRNDFRGIYKATHSLRNTTGYFGLHQIIGQDLIEMEQLARAEKEIDTIRTLYKKISSVCKKAVKELRSL